MFNRKTPVAVLRSGLVVSKNFLVLGATPDAKVVDFGCSLCFSLAEVKGPHTKFHVTPLDACSNPNFFMEKISASPCRLKRNHGYYIVFVPKCMDKWALLLQSGVTLLLTPVKDSVGRIAFDPVFWQDLRNKLIQYYFEHFMSYVAVDFQISPTSH